MQLGALKGVRGPKCLAKDCPKAEPTFVQGEDEHPLEWTVENQSPRSSFNQLTGCSGFMFEERRSNPSERF